MEARLVEYETEEGGSVLIVVEDLVPGMVPASAAGKVAAVAGRTFEAAIESLMPVTEAVAKRFRSLEEPPDICEIEFGITFGMEGRAIIAAGTASANFKVKVTWKGPHG